MVPTFTNPKNPCLLIATIQRVFVAVKILAVDDHPVIALGVQAALEKDGFAEVIGCDD